MIITYLAIIINLEEVEEKQQQKVEPFISEEHKKQTKNLVIPLKKYKQAGELRKIDGRLGRVIEGVGGDCCGLH